MTNREFLSKNPEEMRGMISRARDFIERKYGYHQRMIMTEEEMLGKWLDAPCQYQEFTVVQTIQITTIYRDELHCAPLINNAMLRYLKEATSADDVKLSKVQLFMRDEA